MKKNLIYSVIFLLCGAFFFSSCEDMLNVESNRVEYEFDDWTFNDSVYSVLGILKSVQKVGDKHVLLNELRGDLLSTNERTLNDEYAISNFDFDVTNNKYLDAKDYFSVINNCNVFLARVDTTLQYDNQRLMLREYVAVKSIRAWTYLQLLKNYAYIPFFTEPVLTHSKAEEVMSAAPTDQYTVLTKLIEDIEKFQDPNLYKMPLWEVPDFVSVEMTKKLFMPIRVLLGDLYLWRASLKAETASYPLNAPNPDSDYAKAAKCYQMYLAEDNTLTDNIDRSSHASEKPDEKNQTPNFSFRDRFAQKNFSTKGSNMVGIIHYATNDGTGEVSNLASVFAPKNEIAANQVVASPAIVGLSGRQSYIFRESVTATTFKYYVVNSKNYPGDLRLTSVTASQREELNKTIHGGIIMKHNLEASNTPFISDDRVLFNPSVGTNNIILDRPELVYLRFAEALMGLEREGYTGAKELAMEVLKSGVKEEYKLYWHPDTSFVERVNEFGTVQTAPLLDASGKQVKKIVVEVDEEGNEVEVEIPQVAPIMDVVIASKEGYEPLAFDFSHSTFDGNEGIHSRGSGFTEANTDYELSDSCIAKYYGIKANEEKIIVQDYVFNADGSLKQSPQYEDNGDIKYGADGNAMWELSKSKPKEVNSYDVPEDLYIYYMYDKLIDEMALEGAWEGHRFGDLARMATALALPDFLAKRVAARNVSTADWRTAETAEGWNPALYAKLRDKNNWYMPLPDNYIVPTIVPVTPEPEAPVTPPAGEEPEGGEDVEDDEVQVPVTPPAEDNEPSQPSEDEVVVPTE